MGQGRATIKHRVKLTAEERGEFQALVQRGRVAGWKIKRAQALLKLDEGEAGPGWTDQKVAEALNVTVRSLESWRKQAVERGPQSLMERKAQDGSLRRKLDGVGEAHLTKLACSTPPEGHSGWTLQLLANTLVALNVVDSIGRETVRTTLQKTRSSLG